VQNEYARLQKYGVYRRLDRVSEGEKMVDTKRVLLIHGYQNVEIFEFKAGKMHFDRLLAGGIANTIWQMIQSQYSFIALFPSL
jgi:hypothetical protein